MQECYDVLVVYKHIVDKPSLTSVRLGPSSAWVAGRLRCAYPAVQFDSCRPRGHKGGGVAARLP